MAGVAESAAGGAARVGPTTAETTFSDNLRRRLLIILFFTWLFQVQPILAGQRLDPYRLVLIVMFFPFLRGLATRRAGWLTGSDLLMMAFCGWVVLTFVYHHGTGMFALGSILAIEFFGGYAAGRLLIRNATDFKRYVRYSLIALLILSPLVLFELVTGRMLFGEVVGRFLPVNEKYDAMRFGLHRVQAVFPHSILFGLFCSIQAANVIYIYRGKLARLAPRLGLVGGMTMAALSSAPILSLIIQVSIHLWGVVTRNNWMSLIGLVLAVIMFLEVASTRGPVIILIETLTLDPSTGWWRYYIWVFGIENVLNSPIFGLGMNDWVRPYWMFASSVDNFWLLTAMRHGLPGVMMLILMLAVHVWHIVRAKGLSEENRAIRSGYLIGMVGLCFTLTTVHVWDVMAVYVMFYFGAGSFLYTSPSVTSDRAGEGAAALPVVAHEKRQKLVYARDFSGSGRKFARKGDRLE